MATIEDVGNVVAAEGTVWVCAACGKTSRDRYGEQRISRGWDESCMLNAVLCFDPPEMRDGRPAWTAVTEKTIAARMEASR